MKIIKYKQQYSIIVSVLYENSTYIMKIWNTFQNQK